MTSSQFGDSPGYDCVRGTEPLVGAGLAEYLVVDGFGGASSIRPARRRARAALAGDTKKRWTSVERAATLSAAGRRAGLIDD